MSDKPAPTDLKERLKKEGVKYCLPSYVDIHGVSKSKFVPIEHFDRMMNGSELCTGAALDGVPQDVSDEEVSSRPDPESVIILPWRNDTAWFASDLWCEGKPFEPCSRNIFKGILAQAAEMGFTFNFGIEPEFFLLKEDENGGFVPIGPRDDLAKP
ncbi:MAG TPA: type III glutamate--ammonia ligase, partial [Gammaproteobacteria bacterium]|nr:type III glutamate--ammonia ligase [Gammaproteobacteria bacterium]